MDNVIAIDGTKVGGVDLKNIVGVITNGGAVSRVTWNEGVIAEHDKERGTRRKIMEPKTPYRPAGRELGSGASVCSVTSEDDTAINEIPAEHLAAALQSALDAGSETGSGACPPQPFFHPFFPCALQSFALIPTTSNPFFFQAMVRTRAACWTEAVRGA